MSCVHRRSRVFHNEEKMLYRIRSEGRMKSSDSSTDFKAWSDIVEDKDNSKSNLERNFAELSFLDEDNTECKEQTDEDQDEIIKIFEGGWVEMKTKQTIYNSTTASLLNVEVSYSDISAVLSYPSISCEALIENVTRKAIIEGVVILYNPLTPKIIPEGYFAGTDFPVATELLFVHEEKISDMAVAFSKSDLCRENTSQPLLIPDNSDTEEELEMILKEHLAETEKQINTDLKDEGCQTEQPMEFTSNLKGVTAQNNYIQQKTHSYRPSKSFNCLNRGQSEIPRTVKSQLDLVTIRNYLKYLEFPGRKQKMEVKDCGTDDCMDVYRLFKDTFDNINIQVSRSWSNDIDDDLSFILIHKNAEIIALKGALEAKESYCIEQTRSASAALEKLESIKNVAEECDELKKKLERSQEELKQLKKEKLMKLGFLDDDAACGTERETDSLSTCSLTPITKAKIITREIQFKKKLSDQLVATHEENFQLKEKLCKLEELFNQLGIDNIDTAYIDLKYKFKCLEETIRERDHFRNKMEDLSTRLRCYNYTVEDVEVFKQRSLLLDEVLLDRDRLSKRVEQLRGLDEEVIKCRAKSLRVEQLEDDLRKTVKEKKMAEDEVDVLRGRCSIAEIEVINQKSEVDALRSKLVCRDHEIENLKSASKERERLIKERDHLKNNLDELVRMQDNFEHMKKQMKCLEILKAERDMFKSKYETLIDLESECDILRTQVDKAKVIEKERDSFESQVYDLQACITEQEAEIKRLVGHIDLLAEARDEQQEKLKEVITNLRAELEQKECLMVSAEKNLSMLQNELCDSIQGLSSETEDIKRQNDKLEKQVQKSEQELKVLNDHIAILVKDNENLTKQVNDLIKENNYLVSTVEEKENSLVTLKEVLKDHESILDEFQKVHFQPTAAQRDMETETDEPALITITTTNDQSITFQEKLTRMSKIAGNKNFEKLLLQSKEAIQKIARELEKQYKDWDNIKSKLKYQKHYNTCNKGTCTVGYCFITNESFVNSANRKRRCIRATRKAKLQPKELIDKQDHSTSTNIPFKFTSMIGQPEVYLDTQLLTASKTMQTTEDAFTSIESESLHLFLESIQNEQKDEEVETFESARSVDCELCKILAERLQILEKELSTANETFVQLQDKLDRARGENNALRQQSTEVQDVAKDKIKELVERLKDYKEKCSSLENESNKLQKHTKELRNQKDELENLLANNIVANSRKNSIIEGDLDHMENENKGLKEEINRLEKLEEENMRLREVLIKAQKDASDPKLVQSLQLENEKMTEKIDTQYEEISMLVEKIKTSPSPTLPPELPVDRDKDALRSISDALENQLNKLEKIAEISKPPKVNYKNVIEDLTRRLIDAEKRTEITQFNLSNLKINDPVAMLNAEITNLKQTICIIEDKNSKLNETLLQKIDEIQSQKENIEIIQGELQKKNTELKEGHTVDKLKSQLYESEGELENNANQHKKACTTISALLNDSDTLKQELLRIQNECEKKELKEAKKHDQKEAEENVIYQIETQDLINALDKFRILLAEVKNKLGNSIACDANERLNQEIKENNMLKEANRESEDELSKVKISFSLRDKQVQVLEKRIMRYETENNELKTDLEISSKEIAQLLENLALLQKENKDFHSSKGGNYNINELNDENSKLTEEINRITDNLTESNNEISLLKSENKNLNNNLNETLEDKTIIYDELLKLKYHETVSNQRLVQLESENVQLKKNISTIIEKFKRKIITLQSEMGNLRMENEKLKNNVESAKNEIEIWIQKSSQFEESNKNLLEEYKYLSQIQNDNMNLKKSINEMENENEKLRRQCEEARGDFKKTLSESDNYKANEEKLIIEIEQVEEENKKLKNIINGLIERNEILEKDLESEKSRVRRETKSDEIEKLIQMENECETLKTGLNNALNEVKKCAESQNANKQEIAMLKIEKEEIKNNNNNNNLVETLEEQNSVMKDTNNQLEHEVEKLRSELFDSLRQKERVCELEKKLVSLKNDLDAALQEIKSSNEVALQLRSHNSRQKQQIYDLEYEIDKLTSIIIEHNQNNKTKTENKNFIDKIQELENVAEKLKTEVNILKDERNQLLVDLNKAKENEIHKNLIADLESTNFKLKQGLEPEIVEENSALNDMFKQMEIEHKNLKIKLKNALEDVKNKSTDINKLKEDSKILKQRIADLEKTNIKLKDCNVKIDSPKSEKDIKCLLQKYMDEIAKLKEAHAELIRVLTKKHENENKILKDALNDVEKKLLEANNERDKLKNLLVEQKRKSKDIKGKVDQVEGLINSERRKYKEEQIRNKALDEKINELNEKIDVLDKQLEFKNKEITEMNTKLQKQIMEKESIYDENGEKISITTISEKEMIFFGKPSCACKPNFNYAMKKLAEEGLESLNPDELQVLNNTLAETTADRLAQNGKSFGVLKPDENNKLALLKKIAILEEDLVKKQKHAHQKVTAMKFAVKLEKHRLLESKQKLDEERLKNQKLLSEMGLQSQSISSCISGQEDLTSKYQQDLQTNQQVLKGISQTKLSADPIKHSKRRASSKAHEKSKPQTSMATEMTLKMKLNDQKSQKRHHRCHSPSSTPVKDTNGPSQYGSDKALETLFTSSSTFDPLD